MKTSDLCKVREAQFSTTREHRYLLLRKWEWGPGERLVMFCGLNPSTADECIEDPTVRRCIRFAHGWGYTGMYMMNIFAYRSTDPGKMLAHPDPIGALNDMWLEGTARVSDLIVCCWGCHGAHMDRGAAVKRLLGQQFKLHHLGLTKDGHPKHPLYLRGDLKPQLWP